MNPWIIIYGNPLGGFRYLGPFENYSDACAYVNKCPAVRDHDWWTAPLEPLTTHYVYEGD